MIILFLQAFKKILVVWWLLPMHLCRNAFVWQKTKVARLPSIYWKSIEEDCRLESKVDLYPWSYHPRETFPVIYAIFQLLVVEQPKWVFKQIDKLQRAFLWAGSDSVTGGKCLVRWSVVCTPLHFGGLGIHDLHKQSIVLKFSGSARMRTAQTSHGTPAPSH